MNKRTVLGPFLLITALGMHGCVLTDTAKTGSAERAGQTTTGTDSASASDLPEPARQAAQAHMAVLDTAARPQTTPPAKSRPEPPQSRAADVPVEDADIWDRILAGYGMPEAHNQRVDREHDWYASHEDYLARVSERARPFLYMIMEEIDARGLPAELALLPVVESAYRPYAYSHGHAAGIWQFIPSTGRHFGLKQNWWYDGRRDIHASTQAALDYLQQLSKRFDGDWLLALAAYNAGGGTVSQAIRRNREKGLPTDFWNLRLPRETQAYVPKLLGLARLLEERGPDELQLADIPNEPYLDRVEVGSQIDLALAAELADMDLEDLKRLNPAFNRWATDPDGPHHLLLPRSRVKGFRQELASLPDSRRVTWKRHVVARGETLSEIAQQYDTKVSVLKSANGIRGHLIRAGKPLLIPVSSGSTAGLPGNAGGNSGSDREKVIHVVRSGDNLWDIASEYDVSHKELARWNGLDGDSVLQPGQELAVWTAGNGSNAGSDANRQTVRYNVRKGDSLSTIAHQFNVSIKDLRRWNTLDRGDYIHPGQQLTLHVDIRTASNES